MHDELDKKSPPLSGDTFVTESISNRSPQCL
jgi:hypothetical protein